MPNRPLDLDPDRALRDDHVPHGVIDIGSNSVRLVVYNELGRAPFPRFNEKSLCGLGAGLDRTGTLSAGPMDGAVRAVHRFCAIASAMGVRRLDLLATEAVRRASNGRDFVRAVAGRHPPRSGHRPRVPAEGRDRAARVAARLALSGEGHVGLYLSPRCWYERPPLGQGI
jgi:hypothetical protein